MIRLSSRGTYAMLIMLELCSCTPGKYIPLRNIAAKYGLSTKYLERVIMLKTDYLKTLTVGTHKLTIVYTDGECSTNFVVKQVASSGDKDINSPQTGDNSNLALWFALMPVSGAGTLVTVVNRKRKYHISD